MTINSSTLTPRIAIIGRKNAWSTEILSEALADKSASGDIVELEEISYDLKNNEVLHPNLDLSSYDAFIIKKMGNEHNANLLDQLALLELLEQQGTMFVSSPLKLKLVMSRLSCTNRLHQYGLPMPPTFIGSNIDDALIWIQNHGPTVLKPLYSTKAEGMVVLDDKINARKVLDEFLGKGEKIIYLQQKLNLTGSDYALVFMGSQYIGAYSRVSDGTEWHTTTKDGRRYEAFNPGQDLIDLGQKANNAFNLDFLSVDIAISEELGPVLFEVSAFGAYKGMKEGCGIDVANMVADYTLSKVKREANET
ncbi:MAG: GAK system ATP-grasp enzyme [Pseudomonadales bacterium]|nr:GAK system ATP-grasp enzyme [Pseudomonadales bacterium]